MVPSPVLHHHPIFHTHTFTHTYANTLTHTHIYTQQTHTKQAKNQKTRSPGPQRSSCGTQGLKNGGAAAPRQDTFCKQSVVQRRYKASFHVGWFYAIYLYLIRVEHIVSLVKYVAFMQCSYTSSGWEPLGHLSVMWHSCNVFVLHQCEKYCHLSVTWLSCNVIVPHQCESLCHLSVTWLSCNVFVPHQCESYCHLSIS